MLDVRVDITFWIRNGMNGRYIGRNGKKWVKADVTKGTHSGAI